MDRDAAAKPEKWPLGNAVLKRVTVDGSPPTFCGAVHLGTICKSWKNARDCGESKRHSLRSHRPRRTSTNPKIRERQSTNVFHTLFAHLPCSYSHDRDILLLQ